jgi:hypothetical protein
MTIFEMVAATLLIVGVVLVAFNAAGTSERTLSRVPKIQEEDDKRWRKANRLQRIGSLCLLLGGIFSLAISVPKLFGGG